MGQIKKKFYKELIIYIAACFAIWFAISSLYENIKGNVFDDYIREYMIVNNDISDGNITYKVWDEGIIEVQNFYVADGRIYYSIKGLSEGETFLTFYKADTDKYIISVELRVNKLGIVSDVNTGNYSNCNFHIIMNTLLMTVIAIICLVMLIKYNKLLRYSYELMFVGGFLIWLLCTIISQWYAIATSEVVYEYYYALKTAGYRYILYTAPIIIIFCISMTASNISLIRHERARFTNLLGIIISAVLFFGSIIAIVLSNIWIEGKMKHVYNIAVSIYTTGYSIFAALLEGAIIGGIMAARSIPSADCDYIIILGCMIRKDGSLTPLLKGRVDRAIAHAKLQEKKTGKSPVFIPSGGQGSNEVMAEAEAMRNYLLSQGIPEERILVENKSKNTAENMRFSRKLIQERMENAKVAFSTTNYHVFRSGIIATQNGFMPEGMGSRTKWYFWPNAFMREYIGMLSYTKIGIAIISAMLILGFVALEILM